MKRWLLLALLLASPSSAQTIQFYIHDGSVSANGANAPTSFKVFRGNSANVYGPSAVADQLFAVDGTGDRLVTLPVPQAGTYHVCVKATNAAGDSGCSADLAVTAAAFHFNYNLIDASTDTVLGPLTEGSNIDQSLSCVAIQIVPSASIGSLAKTMDGGTPTWSDGPENSSPYAWPDGAANYPCGTLSAGSHTLKVRAFNSSGGADGTQGDGTLNFTYGVQTPTTVSCP